MNTPRLSYPRAPQIAANPKDAEYYIKSQAEEIERLRSGLDAAIRSANLALFVIRKQGIMPNSSWQAGFEKDMAVATAARADQQKRDETNG